MRTQNVDAATYYIDVTNGNDSYDGLDGATAWKTISKINASSFSPGDNILFKRGEIWRGQLVIPSSGSAGNPITFGAYGAGEMPKLLGSIDLSASENWVEDSPNKWRAVGGQTVGSEMLANPSFDANTTGWSFYTKTSNGTDCTVKREIAIYDSAPAGGRIDCDNGGIDATDIQLKAIGLSVEAGKTYKLVFRAGASADFAIPSIRLRKNGGVFDTYADEMNDGMQVTSGWKTYTAYFTSEVTASDAMVDFQLGGVIPAGGSFFMDTLSLKEVADPENLLSGDVGSLIFNNEESVGKKLGVETNLATQGDFWYDNANKTIILYSTENPATFYAKIEAASRKDLLGIINVTGINYVTIQDLDLRYGGSGGISVKSSTNIIIQHCDFSYIGGSYLTGTNTRFGNAISFLASNMDTIVRYCRADQIYDTAFTTQGQTDGNQKADQLFYYNVASNAEWSFELWDRPDTASMDNIRYENNTNLNAGGGWGHSQRPSPGAIHVALFYNPAATSNLFVRNNIFYESTDAQLFLTTDPFQGIGSAIFDNNVYYQSSGSLISWAGTVYDINQFNNYKSEQNKDANSVMANPNFSAIDNFSLQSDSPAIDAGTNIGQSIDILGNPIYGTPDIGAYEYQPPHVMGVDGVDVAAGARIYGDGKFRDLDVASSNVADLKVTPEVGNFATYGATDTRPDWMDITNLTWNNSGNHHKAWTENSSVIGTTSILHTVGDLEANKYYNVSVDTVLGQNIVGANGTTCTNGLCQADAQGSISFLYTGGYSTHVFDVIEGEEIIITIPADNTGNDSIVKKDTKKHNKYHAKYLLYRRLYNNKISKSAYQELKILKRENPEMFAQWRKTFLAHKYKNKNELKKLDVKTSIIYWKYKNYNGYHNYKIYKLKYKN